MPGPTMDAIIATQVNAALKECASGCARSATEASNPAVRDALMRISQDAIRRQAELVSIMQQNGWYVPPDADPQMVQQLRPQLDALLQVPAGI